MEIAAAVLWATLTLADPSLAWMGGDRAALSFQPNNKPTEDSHASLLLLPATNTSSLSSLSLCLWFKVLHFRGSLSYLCSYATSNKDNNEINFGIRSSTLTVAVGGLYLTIPRQEGLVLPGLWYHFCFVADEDKRTAIFYLNGEVLVKKSLSPRHILLNGSVVLGQETDSVGGGFQAQQSFSGLIIGFNMFSRSLSDAEVASLADCRAEDLEGDVVGWSSADWVLSGPATPLEMQRRDYCYKDNFPITVIPKKMPFDTSVKLCANLKSEVALPRMERENERLYAAALPFAQDCQPQDHSRGFLTLGAIGEDRVWTTLNGEPLNYTNFEGSIKTTKRRCSAFQVPPYQGLWIPVSCGNLKFCVACVEFRPTVLKMRGLCDQGTQDVHFRMEQRDGQMPELRGFTKYFVSLSGNTWNLRNMWTGDVIATNMTQEIELPLGRREWRTVGNFTMCGKPSGVLHELSLSACHHSEFTCGDGSCVDLTHRCDLRVDCPDNSDETGCEKLQLPTEYMESLPPPSSKPGPLILNLSVALHGLSKIDVRDMRIQVDLKMIISWFDVRVQYKNLKPIADLNYIKTSSLWIPTVSLVNADFPSVHRTVAVLSVDRTSPPLKDNVERPARDEIYDGGTNPLRLQQKVNAPIVCVMNLRNFPFDSQQCHILLRLDSATQEFLQWGNVSGMYLGETLLTEYEVGSLTMDQLPAEGHSVAVVSFKLGRRYSYYITSTFLPMTMLLLISYATLFCPRDNRDLRVLMALTTLLVLYSLYQQISDQLPKTSYIKSVDVWCFFCITFIFSQVIFHVAIDIEVEWHRLCPAAMQQKTTATETDANRSLRLARKFYAVVLVLFYVFYWSFVLGGDQE